MSGSESLRMEVTGQTGRNQYSKSSDASDDVDRRVSNADMVVLTDGDADGIAAAALVDYVYEGLDIEIIPVGPHRPVVWESTALDAIRHHGRDDMTVYFLDTCLSDTKSWAVEKLGYLPDETTVRFFDHHEWNNQGRVEFIEGNTSHCEIDTEMDSRTWSINGEEVDERCTAQMIFDYFTRNNVEFPSEIEDRVKAIAAGDLWLRQDAEDGGKEFIHEDTHLFMDSNEFITDQNPADRSDDPWYGYREWADAFTGDADISETVIPTFAGNYREKIDELVDFVYDNSEEFLSVRTEGDMKLASIYCGTSPNEIATRLREDGFDGVAILRPNRRVSFRGTEDFTVCDKIANELDGGGHKQASGGGLNDLNDEDIDINEYQDTYAEKLRSDVLDLMAKHAKAL